MLTDRTIGKASLDYMLGDEDALISDRGAVSLASKRAYRVAVVVAVFAALSAEPAIESVFDVYVDGRSLTYVKEPRAEEYARGRFQLWAFPAHGGALWMDSTRGGAEYESLNNSGRYPAAPNSRRLRAWRNRAARKASGFRADTKFSSSSANTSASSRARAAGWAAASA